MVWAIRVEIMKIGLSWHQLHKYTKTIASTYIPLFIVDGCVCLSMFINCLFFFYFHPPPFYKGIPMNEYIFHLVYLNKNKKTLFERGKSLFTYPRIH